ncbi:MFS transporter [Roseateles toxinivorans]|nr:MFS transporter [Roseateles toxinivorans]
MEGPRKSDAVAAIAATCVFTALDAAMSPGQADVLATFHLSIAEYGWASAVQFLSVAILTPVIARFGDLYDKRAVTGISMAIACLGALVIACAPTQFAYVIGQALLGAWVGGSTVAVALMAELLPPKKQASGQGLIQGASGVFAAAGLLGAGPVIASLGTSSLFWLPVVLVGPCVLFLVRVGRRGEGVVARAGSHRMLDLKGAALLALMLTLFSGSMQFVLDGGWITALSIAGLAVLGAVVLPRWMRAEREHPEPLVDVQLFSRWDISCIHVMALLLGIASTAMYVLFPMLIGAASAGGAGFGSSASVVGWLLLPTGLVGFLLIPAYGVLDRHLKPSSVLALGFGILAIALLLPIRCHQAVWQLLVATTLFGIGMSIALTQGVAELMRRVPEERASSASGTFFMAKTLGGALGAQIAVAALGASAEQSALADLGQLALALSLAAAASVAGMALALSMGRAPWRLRVARS